MRGPRNAGPARQSFEAPFIVVYGKGKSEEEEEKMRSMAVFLANLHYHASDAFVQVYPEDAVVPHMTQVYNLFIIYTVRIRIIYGSVLILHDSGL